MFYVNDIRITPTIFPDKTSQIWNLPEEVFSGTKFAVRWEFESESEIIQLCQLAELLGTYCKWQTLEIKYLPYGRQDKIVSNYTTFALRTFARVLNQTCDFDEINIRDPHSSVAAELIRNARTMYPAGLVKQVKELTNSNVVCYPDKGALVKYNQMYDFPYIFGEKVRDQASGKILKYSICGMVQKNDRVLIIDDICDGGATFLLLAKELYEKGAQEVNLFVTHGIFSKGLKPLLNAGIKRIFTQDGEASGDQTITYRRL